MKKMVNILMLLAVCFMCPSVTWAVTQPSAQNTQLNVSLDRASLPSRTYIWQGLPAGYDENDPPKWGRNTLVCQSRTDTTYGACMTNPIWHSDTAAAPIKLRFTLADSSTAVDIGVVGRRLVPGIGYSSSMAIGPAEATFMFYITPQELNKLNVAGRWTATLKQNLTQWPSGNCTGDVNDPLVGCTNTVLLNTWSAKITFNVTDYGNQQIYLPAFPTSAPTINLNLNTRPGAGVIKAVSGSTTLDMCLYDGNNSASNRITLLLKDEGATAPGRPGGQFSVYRRGGDKSKAGDRLDYKVSVINPTTGAVQNVTNGTEIFWSDTNRRNIQRQVILPGISKLALCVPAPLTLQTPAFSLSDKTAGDYTGTLRIIYTPTTQTAQ